MSLWNVGQWHWEERPQTTWSKERIPELLKEVIIPFEDGSITIESVDTVDGDAQINVRKGKRIVTYEMKVKGSWKGTCGTGTGKVTKTGKFDMPYVCEDVDDHKFQIDFTADEADDESVRMKEKLKATKEQIWAKFGQWIKEMEEKELH
ncbi:putative Activator of Hsp90 ATPase, N-terminal [Monocercomonoides exilis]|uniref:putative Activator of Hsp90 ATPase, N-terminal n=1 Tax=Monocercomonoides exilis TaxID=2049356 RepID=UPI00355AC19A|nr:putative Activator of Hsp90 ATPase, N-terminal [Monocercomonoides exilis]|eukprot:MONOS_1213.1-p1 / transcript=MONOS_1213.1 / gene=MONOS_1213 / organism=Monocercomonoides_exilis_PA203 / gene_product=unspecified product / transcript_product=unspecified product / location=Mono_scaffold00020:219466-220130(-) / protein_length=148 / sequence_SO=supercontig / SO=protein_coding / is_pseudo=false